MPAFKKIFRQMFSRKQDFPGVVISRPPEEWIDSKARDFALIEELERRAGIREFLRRRGFVKREYRVKLLGLYPDLDWHGDFGKWKVGTACIQIGKYLGLKVIGTAGSQTGIDLVTKHGADLVFNHRENGYLQKIQDAVGASGIDLIIEMLANVNLRHDLDLIKFHGTIVNVGSRGAIEITSHTTMTKECVITGVVLLPGSTHSEWLETNRFVGEGISAGWIKPFVGKSYPLEQARLAHEEIMSTSSTIGKIVLQL